MRQHFLWKRTPCRGGVCAVRHHLYRNRPGRRCININLKVLKGAHRDGGICQVRPSVPEFPTFINISPFFPFASLRRKRVCRIALFQYRKQSVTWVAAHGGVRQFLLRLPDLCGGASVADPDSDSLRDVVCAHG